MTAKLALISIPAAVAPAALGLYLALRINVLVMALLSIDPTKSVQARYSSSLANIISFVVLLVAWLVLVIVHLERIYHAPSASEVARLGARALGWSMILFGVVDATFQVATGYQTVHPIAVIIAAAAWVGGIVLVILARKRPTAGSTSP